MKGAAGIPLGLVEIGMGEDIDYVVDGRRT
jgi:hypothetical protein